MDFNKYMDKHVKITFIDGEKMEGIPYCFSGAEDNDEGVASIRMDGYELYENEIASIEIIPADMPVAAKVV